MRLTTFYKTLFIVSGILFTWYIFSLINKNYINIFHSFDLNTANNISPFIGNFIGPLVSIASALLVYDNLIVFKKNIEDENNKNRIDLTLSHCKMYYSEIHSDMKELADRGIVKETMNSIYYLKVPLNHEQLVGNKTFEYLFNKNKDDYAMVAKYLNKIEYLASFLKYGDSDEKVAFEIIGQSFLTQVSVLLPYIAFFRIDKNIDLYTKTTDLYKKWGGTIGDVLDRIED
jgi:hypothetical protein